MTSTQDTTKLIERAVHGSVTEQKLTKLGFGFLEGDLHTQPLIDYLAADEQPHFIFSRGMADREITIEGPNAPSPPREKGSNKTIHLTTDRRWLVVAGNKDGDQTLSVPLDDITGVAVETKPWTNTVSFTTDRFRLEAQINIDEKEALDALHRWLVVNADVDGTGLKQIEETETLRDGTESEGVTSLVETAAHGSVTEPRLTERKTGLLTRDLYTKPLIDYLTDEEQPQFILDTHGANISLEGAYAPRVPEHNGSGTVKHLITDRRWLVVAANRNGDQTLDVPLVDITGINVDTGISSHTVSITTERFRLDAPIANAHDNNDLRFVQQFLLANTRADGTGLKEIERSLAVHMTQSHKDRG